MEKLLVDLLSLVVVPLTNGYPVIFLALPILPIVAPLLSRGVLSPLHDQGRHGHNAADPGADGCADYATHSDAMSPQKFGREHDERGDGGSGHPQVLVLLCRTVQPGKWALLSFTALLPVPLPDEDDHGHQQGAASPSFLG